MKLRQHIRSRRCAAFTMVEIAICIAIIGFALVAIVGVLPFGMRTQRDNREETVINQDATYFLDAIRSGSRGADMLTNYVQYIAVYTWSLVYSQSFNGPNGSGWVTLSTPQTHVYTNLIANTSIRQPTPVPGPAERILSGEQIIGLLSTPRYKEGVFPGQGGMLSNYVVAYVRSISGPAVDKGMNSASREFAFHYRLVPEILPAGWTVMQDFWSQTNGMNQAPIEGALTNRLNSQWKLLQTTSANLHEVRLLFRWPVLSGADPASPNEPRIGGGRQVYRTLVGGRLDNVQINRESRYFFRPGLYREVN